MRHPVRRLFLVLYTRKNLNKYFECVCVCGVVHAELQAGGDDLISRPDLEGEGALSVAKHGIGAVVKPLERRNGATTAHPDEGGAEEVSRPLDWLFIWDFSLYRSQVCMVVIYFR